MDYPYWTILFPVLFIYVEVYMSELGITISKHAKERFSERIMNQYGVSNINVFIAGHEDF